MNWSSRGSAGGIATSLRAERCGVRIQVGSQDFYLQNAQTGSGTHSAYSMGTGIPSPR